MRLTIGIRTAQAGAGGRAASGLPGQQRPDALWARRIGSRPRASGLAALEWAKENDRRLLAVVTDMRPERIVPEVRQRLNACGGGAIAAMLAACREHGATEASVLRHASSFETLRRVAPQTPDNAVGYAGVVVG